MDRVHLLTDNEDLSGEEYVKARARLDSVQALHLGARQHVERQGLDPNVFLPGNIWARINDPDHFTQWTYGLVNYAKCISPFSGFDSMMWGRRDTPGQVDCRRADEFYARFISGALSHTEV